MSYSSEFTCVAYTIDSRGVAVAVRQLRWPSGSRTGEILFRYERDCVLDGIQFWYSRRDYNFEKGMRWATCCIDSNETQQIPFHKRL